MDARLKFLPIFCALALGASAIPAFGQGYGTDLQNVMAPASGGMAGVSTARPQDVQSAIFGNPATLAQFHGTQFSSGGGWIEGYPHVTNNGDLNPVSPGTPFTVTSHTQGFAAVEIGASQSFEAYGMPVVFGMGVSGLSGMGAEYKGEAPAGSFVNDITGELLILGVNFAGAAQVTDNVSIGAAFTLGSGFEQLGLVAPNLATSMVNAYGIRGTVGIDWSMNDCNDFGFYYMSPMAFDFPQGIRVGTDYRDVKLTQPTTFGWGWANRALMNGNLLIGADVYYKLWDDSPLYRDVYVNQWAFAFGTQLTRGHYKYRAGYSYNTNPLDHSVGSNLDGVPIGQSALQLYQAATAGTINQHRITGGVGYQGFLVPNLDIDTFVGGMFNAHDTFGSNQESVAVWYAGLGFTWKFGSCSPRPCED